MSISINFIKKEGWMETSSQQNMPKNFFFKNQYPFYLWWEEKFEAFYVVYKDELMVTSPTIIGRDTIGTEEEYDKFMISFLNAKQDAERSNN